MTDYSFLSIRTLNYTLHALRYSLLVVCFVLVHATLSLADSSTEQHVAELSAAKLEELIEVGRSDDPNATVVVSLPTDQGPVEVVLLRCLARY